MTRSEEEEEEEHMWNSTMPSSSSTLSSSAAAMEKFRAEAKQQELLQLAEALKAKQVKPAKPLAAVVAGSALAKTSRHFQIQRNEEIARKLQERENRAGARKRNCGTDDDDEFESEEEESSLEEEEDTPPPRRQLPARRKVITPTSSSSEEEEIDTPQKPNPRKVLVVGSSSSEEETAPPRKSFLVNPKPAAPKKKHRFIMSSSSSEDDEVVAVSAPKRRTLVQVEDSGEEEGGEDAFEINDGSSDEDDKGNEKLWDLQVQEFLQRCESLSNAIKQKICQGDAEALSESKARELVNNPELTLKPYQIAGVNWISLMDKQNINPVLADEMGLGKTITSCMFLRLLMHRDGNMGPHLIIAPASTVENWVRELKLWLPELECLVYNGSQGERKELRHKLTRTSPQHRPKVWICTYTYFERESCEDDRRFLGKQLFEVMVLDEAHAIKNTESTRYQSLLQLQAKRKLLLTGTPCQNKLDELFALLSFCLPKNLLNCGKGRVREAIFGSESDPSRVKRILQPFILRRLKTQVLRHLAPKTETVVLLDMCAEQAKIYKQILLDFKHKSKSRNATSENVFTELRKACNHPLMLKHQFGKEHRDLGVVRDELLRVGYFGRQATRRLVEQEVMQKLSDWDLNAICQTVHGSQLLHDMVLPSESLFTTSCKMQFLRKFIPEQLAGGHRILLFSQWTKLLDLFEELLTQLEIKFMRLDGSTAVDTRQDLMDEYNGGLAPVFLLSTRAGGLGINLTSADVVILHDLDFNPAIDMQAMDRCHRYGQTKPVAVYKLVTRRTVDENICQMQVRKTGMNNVLLGEEGEEVRTIEQRVDDDEQEKEALLPSLEDFSSNFAELDDKELDKMTKQMMKDALKEAVNTMEEE